MGIGRATRIHAYCHTTMHPNRDIDAYRILLIEDSQEFALIAMNWLMLHFQYRVVHMSDGAVSAKLIAEKRWDLIIADIELPGVSGSELARLSKTIDATTPVLLVTAHRNIEYTINALENRVDGFLFKPFTKDVFIMKVMELLEQKRMEKKTGPVKRVLAIGAHPDDVEIGCGGALALHRMNGDPVSILTLSVGACGGDAIVRKAEAIAAAEIINARIFLGDLVDTKISEGAETIQLIVDAIKEVDPTHVYTHSARDAHQDHRNVHHASVVACRQIPNLYCYQSPSSTIEYQPSAFVDISSSFSKKMEMIGAYKSQVMLREYLKDDLIKASARYWGRFGNYGLAEPMEVQKQRN
jgi:LmbE family N-acetylglucosaminyl deacetylase